MARFVVDCGVVLELASGEVPRSPPSTSSLLPTLLRSQTLSALHKAVHHGDLPADVARDRLKRVGAMPIRLLGDAVLRRRAWEIADQLGWAETYDAEYVALTLLQADAFVTATQSSRGGWRASSRLRLSKPFGRPGSRSAGRGCLPLPRAWERTGRTHLRRGGTMRRTDASGRDWSAIGVGSVAAAAIIALYAAGIWGLSILVEALV